LALVFLGSLAWALAREPSNGATPGAGAAQRVEVPDVVGLSLQEARGRLDGAGLELGSQTEAVSSGTAAGAVVEQDPAADSEAERGTAVDVIISTGPALEPTTQPSSASSTASFSASSTSATSTTSASAPANGEVQNQTEEAQKQAEGAAKTRQKTREKAQKKAEKETKKSPPRGGGKKQK